MDLSTFDTFKRFSGDGGQFLTLSDKQVLSYQPLLLEIMDDIIACCEDHAIPYAICGGTALGAVRHEGFIPWDDDLDIEMTRKHFDRFVPIFQKEYGTKYWIHTPGKTHNHCILLGKIRKKGTVAKCLDDIFNDEENGAFIDIFPVENTFNNPFLRRLHGYGCLLLGGMLSCRRFFRDREMLLRLAARDRSVQKVFKIKIALGWIISFFPIDIWTRIANWWSSICKNDESTYVTVPSGRQRFFGEMFTRSQRCELQKTLFCGRQVNIARDIDHILTTLYGNYMEIPPPDYREKHLFLAFDMNPSRASLPTRR